MGRLRWSEKFSIKNHVGSTLRLYICSDMNGPSVFNGPEVTMSRDALYNGGVGHREPRNAYSYYLDMATSNGFVKRGDGKDRPFVLSRAFFSGSRRCWWVFKAILRQLLVRRYQLGASYPSFRGYPRHDTKRRVFAIPCFSTYIFRSWRDEI